MIWRNKQDRIFMKHLISKNAHSRQFSWDNSARETLKVIKSVAEGKADFKLFEPRGDSKILERVAGESSK